MISRRKAIAVWLTGLIAAMVPALALAKKSSAVARFDTDHDGTVSLDEAKKAAGAEFDKLDRDHDGTLTRRELRGRLSIGQFSAADIDKDGTMSKDEYLAVVEKRFKAADADNDGTLNDAEFRTPAGRSLLRLLD
jgi:Ca2+-binding EF-hand superfamily protein